MVDIREMLPFEVPLVSVFLSMASLQYDNQFPCVISHATPLVQALPSAAPVRKGFRLAVSSILSALPITTDVLIL